MTRDEYLVDTSAYVRINRSAELLSAWADEAEAGTLAVCPLNELEILATAEEHGLVLLHYDAGFQCVSEITGQRVQWLAEPGTIS